MVEKHMMWGGEWNSVVDSWLLNICWIAFIVDPSLTVSTRLSLWENPCVLAKISTSISNPTQNYFSISIYNTFVYIIMRLKLKYIFWIEKIKRFLTAIRVQHPPLPSEFSTLASKMCHNFMHMLRSLILFKPSVVPLFKNMLRTKLKPRYMIFFQNVCLHFSNLCFWHICNVCSNVHQTGNCQMFCRKTEQLCVVFELSWYDNSLIELHS